MYGLHVAEHGYQSWAVFFRALQNEHSLDLTLDRGIQPADAPDLRTSQSQVWPISERDEEGLIGAGSSLTSQSLLDQTMKGEMRHVPVGTGTLLVTVVDEVDGGHVLPGQADPCRGGSENEQVLTAG